MKTRYVLFFTFVASLNSLAVIVACSSTPQKQAQVATDTGKVIQCVLDNEGKTPEQIIGSCAGVTLVDVISILAIKKRIQFHYDGGTE